MKFRYPIVIRLVISVVAVLAMVACGSGRAAKAIKSYDIGEYHRAEGMLKTAYKNEKQKYSKGEFSFYLGECYRKLGMPKKAASSYGKAIRSKYSNSDALLYMAAALRQTGEIDKAIDAYTQYIDKNPFNILADNGLKSCRMVLEAPVTGPWIVEKVVPFSSKFSDYAPAYAGSNYDQVYFTSMRSDKKKRKLNRVTGQGNSSIFVSRLDGKGVWSKPERVEEPIASPFDDGTPGISFDGKKMYFTRCPYDNTKPNTAEVFEVERTGGKWGDPQRLLPGGDSLMMAHPAISPDGNTLYFVSERAGGFGGKDIYKTVKIDGEWTAPQNLGGIINTKGDEMFPYVSASGTLYFASNGHVGFGGLDIFRVDVDEKGNEKVVNLGSPINSESDDFGIVFQGNKGAGLFSSNRGSAKGIDNIYSFVTPEVTLTLNGTLQFPANRENKDAVVRLVGTDGTNIKLPLGSDGSFGAPLAKETDYVVLASAPGFYNTKENFSTGQPSESRIYDVRIKMSAADEVMTFEPLYFQKGSTVPVGDIGNIVNRAANYLKGNQKYRIDIRCHTSSSGKDDNDIKLADQRGEAVTGLLKAAGIDQLRISVDAVGSQEPAVVTPEMLQRHPLLKKGEQITSQVLRRLKVNDRKDVEQLNDRVELVLIVK